MEGENVQKEGGKKETSASNLGASQHMSSELTC